MLTNLHLGICFIECMQILLINSSLTFFVAVVGDHNKEVAEATPL